MLLELVADLLDNSRTDPADRDNLCIRSACRLGHTDVVSLLLTDRRVKPSTDNNAALKSACMNNRTEIVKTLLASPWVTQPTKPEIDELLSAACRMGARSVVELLLERRSTLISQPARLKLD